MNTFSVKRAAALSALVLAGFAQGLAAYIFVWAIAVGGIKMPQDFAMGLLAAALQGIILTTICSVVILPLSFGALWFARRRVAAICASISTGRALLYADCIGIVLGVVAGLAGLRLPTMM